MSMMLSNLPQSETEKTDQNKNKKNKEKSPFILLNCKNSNSSEYKKIDTPKFNSQRQNFSIQNQNSKNNSICVNSSFNKNHFSFREAEKKDINKSKEDNKENDFEIKGDYAVKNICCTKSICIIF